MSTQINVAAYVRYSSENQRDGYSIEAQKNAIQEYCARNNYRLVAWYIDEALSGRTDEREEFQKAIEDSDKKLFEVLVIHKLDRFARNRYDSIHYRRELKKHGVRLESVLEKIDDNNPEDIILLSVLEGMNEYYSKNLSREVRKGLMAAAKQGKTTGGITPYGYKPNPVSKKLEIVESEAMVIREMFNKYNNGLSMVEIAEWLESIGVKSRVAGKKVTIRGVYSMLTNLKYVGTYVYNAYRNYDYTSKKQETVVVENAIEPIISKHVFDKAQQRIENIRRGQYTRRSKQVYLLSGIIVDGKDGIAYRGKSMQKVKNGKSYNYSYYAKSGVNKGIEKLPKELFELRITEILKQVVFSDNGLELLRPKIESSLQNKKPPTKSEVIELEKEIKNANVQLNRLLDLYLDGSLDKEAFKIKRSALNERISFFQSELNKKSTITKVSANDILKTYKKIGMLFDVEGVDTLQKSIINKLIKKISIFDETFEIEFTLPIYGMKQSFMLKNTDGGAMVYLSMNFSKTEVMNGIYNVLNISNVYVQ